MDKKELGRWADLRSGDMYQGDEPQLPSPFDAILGLLFWAAFFGLLGLIAGYALGDVPEFVSGPGADICNTKGC